MEGEGSHAVVFGAASMVGRHLVRRLAERGARSALPEPALCSFAARGAAGLFLAYSPGARDATRCRDGGPALSRAHRRAATADRTHEGGQAAGRVEHGQSDLHGGQFRPGRACRIGRGQAGRGGRRSSVPGGGIAWTILRPTLIYDPGRDRNISAIAAIARRFRFVPRRVARQRAPPADPRRRRGAGHDRRPGCAGCRQCDSGPPRRRDADVPRHGSPDFRSLGRRPLLLYLPLGPRGWPSAYGSR